MSDNTEVTQGEELWLYVSDPEAVFDFLQNPPGPVPEARSTDEYRRAHALHESIRAVRRPHRARISAEQELWYALVRIRLAYGESELRRILGEYTGDIQSDDFRKAAELVNSTDPVDSA